MRALAPLLTLGTLVPAASPACSADQPDPVPEELVAQPSGAEAEPTAPDHPPGLDYGSSMRVELHPPTGPRIAIFEGEEVEVILDSDALSEDLSGGSAFEFILQEVADAAEAGRPARFPLEPGLTMNITSQYVVRGDAGARVKGTSGSVDHVFVVPWSSRSAPNHHGQGGVEVRLPTGQVVLGVMSWIE